MLLVLPPSETKRDGGAPGTSLDLGGLSFPELARPRRTALARLGTLSRSVSASTVALGLGPSQRDEIERNRAVRRSPVLPAIERYTGVLYDGLDAASMSAQDRDFAHEHVVIHSALFGLVRAGDAIPAYRLSHDSRLPGVTMRGLWREPISQVLGGQDALVLDLRSEAYASLGPAPRTGRYVRVVTEDAAGRRLALSHFNKKAKGEFARALITGRVAPSGTDDLLAWARAAGIRLERGAEGELDLVV